jgi:hypothetical protein
MWSEPQVQRGDVIPILLPSFFVLVQEAVAMWGGVVPTENEALTHF